MAPLTASIRDQFVTLPENRSALRAIRRLTRHVLARKPFPHLFLYGPPGSGKSHLAGVLVEDSTAQQAATVQLIAALDLGRLLTRPPGPDDPRRELRSCDLLVVEDVQHFPAAAADGFAHLLDHRQARGRYLLATAPLGPALLRHLPRRLTSRLASGIVVGIEPLPELSRRKLAAELCGRRGLRVTNEVIEWLARSPSGTRSILGAIARLEALGDRVPPPMTLEVIRERLCDEPMPGLMIERIAQRMADSFGVSMRQLKGRARHHGVLWPRQVGMFLARQLTELSLTRIGAFFGGRDHTTVLHACQKVGELRDDDPALASLLRQLEAELQ